MDTVTPCAACRMAGIANRDPRGNRDLIPGLMASADLMVFQPQNRATWAARVYRYFVQWSASVENEGVVFSAAFNAAWSAAEARAAQVRADWEADTCPRS